MDTKADNQEVECQQVSEALTAHFDGMANNSEQQLAKAHLAHCSSCSQMWREWQSLRLMEQCALQPVASGDMLPLAPVMVPRHLKSAILRKTVVVPPIWQRFWPRLLTGMGVPTFAVACWLLIVTTPWQQSMPEITTQPNPVPENRIAAVPDTSSSTSLNVTDGIASKALAKIAPSSTTKSVAVASSKIDASHSSQRTESKSVSDAPTYKIKQSSHVTTASTNKHSTKSTFTGNPEPRTQNPEPLLSMASFDRPRSRAAKSVIKENVRPVSVTAPKPRATEPVLIAYLPIQDMSNSTDASSDPMFSYIAQNDVRPDDIRQAVENYRAALLDNGSDL